MLAGSGAVELGEVVRAEVEAEVEIEVVVGEEGRATMRFG
jgi:hypothetical protein